jgi:hypothetical protein
VISRDVDGGGVDEDRNAEPGEAEEHGARPHRTTDAEITDVHLRPAGRDPSTDPAYVNC